MRYLGNKTRLAKHLAPILTRKPGSCYIEPFAGALGMISNITHRHRRANDACPYITALMTALQDNYIPPDNVSLELYNEVKNNIEAYPKELVGFIGYGCSFGGKWFNGYARGGTNNNSPRDYAAESARNLLALRPKIQDVLITNYDYRNVQIPDDAIVYCDPPYRNTTEYKQAFNHNEFYDWVREISAFSTVYISEYTLPEDFKLLWEKKHKVGIDTAEHSIRTERLYTVSS